MMTVRTLDAMVVPPRVTPTWVGPSCECRQSGDGCRAPEVTVDDQPGLGARFEAHRPHLRAVAHRVLGSPAEAEDAVQESWLRLSRADAAAIDNLGGWLTTVVARVSLDMLRARGSRREDLVAEDGPDRVDAAAESPEDLVLVADSVSAALLVVLDTLGPAERVAFVLHDVFAVPFEDVAVVLDRSTAAAKQLASRGRRRVRAAGPAGSPARAGHARQREVVEAFLAASRGGDLAALLALLAPDVVLRADPAAVRAGAAAEARGPDDVAATFAGRARAARPTLVDGVPGAAWAAGGQTRVVFRFTLDEAGRIAAIDLVADADEVRRLVRA
jgi:RNA polymerase sigma-70 factor (ECF subfamily)